MIENNKLNKSFLVKKNTDFADIFKNGKIYRNNYFIVAVRQEQKLRIGFTTKSGLKKVTRNRLKRMGRELWRLHHHKFNLSGSWIFLTREKCLLHDHLFLEDEFVKLLATIEKDQNRAQFSE